MEPSFEADAVWRQCIHTLFEQQAEYTPDAIAVVSTQAHLTYRELNQRANQLAHYLSALNVGPEMLVGMCLERSLDMLIGVLAIFKAGGAYLPLDPTYPPERLTFMIAQAQVSVLLTQRHLLAQLAEQHVDKICLEQFWASFHHFSERSTNPIGRVDAENLAYVMYTSGSTGRPKGVLVPHRGLYNLAREQLRLFALDSRSRVLQFASISFDAFVSELITTLLAGATLCLIDQQMARAGEALEQYIQQQAITIVTLPPSVLMTLSRPDGSALSTIISAGEACSLALVRYWGTQQHRFLNAYGPTEATVCTTVMQCDEQDMRPPTIGHPIANVQVYVLDEVMQLMPIGVPGELYIGGCGLARGYINQPDRTAEKFVPHLFSSEPGARLYRTGDLARYLPDGTIEFLGRADQQVKLRGFRIELGEIEAVLNEHTSIREAVVLVQQARAGDKRLVGYLIFHSSQSLDAENLQQYLHRKLPHYMVPSTFLSLERLPLTVNGKLDRNALLTGEMKGAMLGTTSAYEAPRTPLEEQVSEIWKQVLDIEEIGVHDNFFLLGGDSLLATQVVSRIQATFQVGLTVDRLFKQSTIADLAEHINYTMPSEQGEVLIPLKSWPRTDYLPLSFAQQPLWFLERWHPNSVFYSIPVALHVKGPLNRVALERGINGIIQRHEILRTRFVVVDEQPMQLIAQSVYLPLQMMDLMTLPEDEREQKAQQLIIEEARQSFDLAADSLLRVRLIHICEDEHLFLLTMHHIISDGWSMELFMQELSALYKSYLDNQPSSLPALPIQYADFALWQRQWLDGEAFDAQLNYWRKQLHGAPELLRLPTDYSRPAVQTFRGVTATLMLPKDLSEMIKALSRQEGITLFMTLLAAFKVLLYRYSGQEDIVVGSPIANRNRTEIEGMIGFFVNTLVLRSHLAANMSFRDLLGQVRELTLQAYIHQDLPFEKLVEVLNPLRNPGYNPLFQVLFVLQNVPESRLHLPQAQIKPLRVTTLTSRFDLTMTVMEMTDGLCCEVEYCTDLFEASTIARMLQHWQVLLRTIVSHPEKSLGSLSLFSHDEIMHLSAMPRTRYPDHLALPALFEAQVQRTPNAVAVVYENDSLTYGELNRRANQLAHYLRELRVGPNVLVPIYMERSLGLIVGLLGILKAGGAYVPLDPIYAQERLSFMLDSIQAPVLITQSTLLERLPEGKKKYICLDSDHVTLARQSRENPEPLAGPDDMIYMIYTSGSTGRPKGAGVYHQGFINLLHWFISEFAILPIDRVLLVTSISFDLTQKNIFAPLLCGASVYIPPSGLYDARVVTQTIYKWQISLLNCTPSAFYPLLDALDASEGECLASLRYVFLGGEPIVVPLIQGWLTSPDCHAQIVNTYGPTECSDVVSFYRLSLPLTHSARSVPIGRSISNTNLLVLDANLQVVPVGVVGELTIVGDCVGAGYMNDSELTALKFVPCSYHNAVAERMYRTGDLARYLPDGTIEFLGRLDQQVKLRGFRIELGEIETVLRDHMSVREAVVLLQPAASGEKRMVCYLVFHPSQFLSAADLHRYLRSKLPDYMVPSAFLALEALPLNANGKLDRRALLAGEVEETALEITSAYEAPRTPVEEVIAEIWAQLLGCERVGIHDNFFEMGGHSLLATRVLSRMHSLLHKDVPLQTLFEHPTVAALAYKLQQAFEEQVSLPSLLPVAHSHTAPLTFAQEGLWFLTQLEPLNPFYHIPCAIRLTGLLNVSALEKSLQMLIDRHEVLRTHFMTQDGDPSQVITPSWLFNLPLIDLNMLEEIDRQQQIDELTRQHVQRPFDLTQGPLFRFQILRLGNERHILLLCLHHMICDGWSLSVFFQELTSLYAAFCDGYSSPLSPLPVQYADFALWQRNWLRGEVMERYLTYWKHQLRDLSSLTLPTDYPRPAVQEFVGASQSLWITRELAEKLNQLSRREGVSLFMTLLAAFQILLARYSGQSDIVVGTTVATRPLQDLEGMIGFFVNTLVLRIDVSGNLDFRELLKRVREMSLQAYAHQDFPFEQLVKALNPQRSLSHNPLFQVLVNMLNFPDLQMLWPGLATEIIWPSKTEAKFDITLYIDDHTWNKSRSNEEGIQLEIAYNARLFLDKRIDEMLHQFIYLLTQIVNDTEQRITKYSLFTPVAQVLIPDPTVELDADWPGAIHTAVAYHAQRTPHHIAVRDVHESWNYKELEAHSNQLAHYLQAHGIHPQDVVAIYGHRSVALVWALLGILKAGATFLILDPAYPVARLCECLSLAQPRAWVHIEAAGPLPERIEQMVTPYPCQLVLGRSSNPALEDYAVVSPEIQVYPDDIAYIAFTSGSAGKLKGIQGRHSSLSHFLPWYVQTFGFNETDRFSMLSGLSHDPLHREIFTALWIGATICIPDTDSMGTSAWPGLWMRQERITIANLTPAVIQLLVQTQMSEPISLLRYVLTVGDVLIKYHVECLYRLTPSVQCIHLYGTTETQQALGYFIDTRKAVSDETLSAREIIPLGRGIPDVQLLILNHEQALVGIGEIGEICVRSPHIARGYLKNDALTREHFVLNPFTHKAGDRLYRTGDLGLYRPDGVVEYVGRRDQQIKLRGFRIEVGEIEGTLSTHAMVREAVVALREDAQRKYLVAYVVPQNEQVPTVGELTGYLREKLPEFMVPVAFVFLETLPLNANGKVDRHKLPAPERTDPKLIQNYVAPRTSLEKELVELWNEALHLTKVGIHDNFFSDLRCDSLQCLQLVARARQAEIQFTVKQLFQYQTLSELACILEMKMSNRREDENISHDQGYINGKTSETGDVTPLKSIYNLHTTHTSLVGRNLAGTKRPFFCVHAISGEVVALASLASSIGSDQPFYLFRAVGLDGEREPLTSIEAIAAYYIDAMRTIVPDGPYLIGGWSFGGRVAFEMALQLQRQGARVALLALIDTYGPDADREPPQIEYYVQIAAYVRGIALRYQLKEPEFFVLDEEDLQKMTKDEQLQYMVNAASLAGADWIPSDKKLLEAYLHVTMANELASYNYWPQGTYHHRVAYFKATNRREPDTGTDDVTAWQHFTSTPIDVHNIPATHENIVHESNALALLVEKMRRCFEQAEDAMSPF